MKKIIPRFYFILLAAGIVLICLSMRFAGAEIYDKSIETERTEVEPANVVQVSENVREFYFKEGIVDDTNSCLAFFSSHQAVQVYMDDELVYSITPTKTLFGNTTGSHWIYVEIPEDTQEILVRAEALYPQIRDYKMTFYQGNGLHMYAQVMRSSALEVIVSIFDIVIGLGLILYWCLVRKNITFGAEILYFGMFAVCIGWWSFNETELASMLIRNSAGVSFTNYMLLHLGMAPFVLFVRLFLGIKNRFWAYLYCSVTYVYMIVCVTLHMTGIRAFKQTVLGVHFLLGCGIIYLIGAVVARWRKRGFDRKVRENLIGALVLSVALAIDIVAFYLGLQETDVLGRIGLLVYICLLGMESAKSVVKQINEGKRAEVYRELAVKDMLTGLYSRNAYDQWVGKHEVLENVMLVTFDLNNLKKCNDTQGHSAGDRYIADAAAIVQKVFCDVGMCFRIGGDEFCVVIEQAQELNIATYLKQLQELQQDYNKQSEEFVMQIACGYAAYDATSDKNLEETRERADASMYRNKRAIKESMPRG